MAERDSYALIDQGVQYYTNQDYVNAFALFMESAQMNNPIAMNNVSVCYYNGQGVEADEQKAFEWMLRSAQNGYVPACREMGNKYAAINEYDNAIYWVNKAIEYDPTNNEYKAFLEHLKSRAKSYSLDPIIDEGIYHYNNGNYDVAFQKFMQAAVNGAPAAMHDVSICYNNGQGVEKDPKLSFEWALRAANLGFSLACQEVAGKYATGNGVYFDLDQAFEWQKKAIEADPHNQSLVEYYHQLEQLSNDAVYLTDRANELFNMNQMDKAFRIYERVAQLGDISAFNNLSVCYAEGYGVPADYVKSFELMKKAAEGGFGVSFYPLAFKYHNGLGTEKDDEQARFWIDKALQFDPNNQEYQKLKESLSEKAGLLEQGLAYFQQQDYDNAFRCFMSAAEQGLASAMNNLSFCYAKGYGTAIDEVKAFEWMKKAAENGVVDSCFRLAVKYHDGTGTQVDLKQCEYWCAKACELQPDNQEYKDYYDALKNEISRRTADPEARTYFEEGSALWDSNPEKSFSLLMKAAEMGHSDAMQNISAAYYRGRGVEKDFVKSFEWCLKAAEMDNPISCGDMFTKYATGSGTDVNPTEAIRWLEKAYELNPENYKQLYTTVASNLNLNNYRKVEARLVKGANKEEMERLVFDGVIAMLNNNNSKALSCFETAGKAGHYLALRQIGNMYHAGKGVPQDGKAARDFFEAAAMRGDDYSRRILSTGYTNGTFTTPWKIYTYTLNDPNLNKPNYPQDTDLAAGGSYVKNGLEIQISNDRIRNNQLKDRGDLDLYIKAAVCGYPDAFCALAEREKNRDHKTSVSLWKYASLLGHSEGLYNLGLHYLNVDRNVAKECFRLAAERGHKMAAANLL